MKKNVVSYLLPLFSAAFAQVAGEAPPGTEAVQYGCRVTPDYVCNDNNCNGNYYSFSDIDYGRNGATFEVGVACMWLQPFASNLSYAARTTNLTDSGLPSWVIKEQNPDYSFGYDANVRAFFDCTNSWVAVNYQNFHANHETHFTVTDDNYWVAPLSNITTDFQDRKVALANVRYTFDEVNVDYGFSVDFCKRLRASLFGGITYAGIRQTLIRTFSTADGLISNQFRVPSKFTGIGPQIGIEFAYKVWNCFDLTGKTSAGLLVGRAQNHSQVRTFSPALESSDPNIQRIYDKTRDAAIPAFEQRLGLAFNYVFCGCYDFTVEGGYQAKVYLNAFESVDIDNFNTFSSTTTVFVESFKKTSSNFVLAGPYLNCTLAF